jgi:hypothetical protein
MLKTSFERIKSGWAELEKRRITEERDCATRYNIFRLIGLERSEVALHSPFLCNLLNPYGSHGQGTLFLRSFLELLAKRQPHFGEILSEVTDPADPSEWIVLPERQRIDISIIGRKAGLVIFVENKIDAREQEDQLQRYWKLLKEENYSCSVRLLVFLSPRNYGRPQTGKPDIYLTYEDDVWPWLSAIEPNIQAVHLRGVLQQYCRIIKNMDGKDTVEDQRNRELIDLLKQQENILCALDISDTIADVKDALRSSMWEQIDADLRRGLNESGLAASWAVGGLDELKREPRKNWQGVYFTSIDASSQAAQLQLGLWQEGSEARLFYGIGFSKVQPDPHPLNEITELWNALTYGYRWANSKPQQKWVCYRFTDIYSNSREFCVAAASSTRMLTRPWTDTVVDLLRKHHEVIQTANRALSAFSGTTELS